MYLNLSKFFIVNNKKKYPFGEKILFWETLKGFLCYFIDQAESRKRAVSTVINFYFQNFYFYFRVQKKEMIAVTATMKKWDLIFFEATFFGSAI